MFLFVIYKIITHELKKFLFYVVKKYSLLKKIKYISRKFKKLLLLLFDGTVRQLVNKGGKLDL
jgi:hypothetical protein